VRAAAIYENMGDFAAAEEIYECLLKQDCLGEGSTIANLVRLYMLFRNRVADMDIWEDESTRSFQQMLPYLYTFHRASVLDSELLNTALLNSAVSPQTWLLSASTAGSSKIVQQLLEKDLAFDLEAEDVDKCTALHRVVEHGWSHIAMLLLGKGVNVNCRNKWLKTPLHVAIQNGHISTVTLLLNFGADASAKSHTGRTPQSYVPTDMAHLLEDVMLTSSFMSSSHLHIDFGFESSPRHESFISPSALGTDLIRHPGRCAFPSPLLYILLC
jgi:Ankyrin repeats (3 copies)